MAKERGHLWTDAEVTALIAIWGEEEIQRQLDGATRNIKVYEKLAARLSSLEDCSDRTAVQCREKIKKLKGDYRKAKDNNNRSGRGRTICGFFNQLDAILGCRPASAPDTVVGSMRSMGDEASVHCGDERRNESSEPTATDEGEENVDHVLRTPDVSECHSQNVLEPVTPNRNATTSENISSCTAPIENQSAKNRGKGKKRQHSALMDCIDKFVEYQSAARSEFLEWEERRQKREEDMEETRRREERDHELRLFQLLAGTHSSSPACPSYSYQCQQGGNDLPEN